VVSVRDEHVVDQVHDAVSDCDVGLGHAHIRVQADATWKHNLINVVLSFVLHAKRILLHIETTIRK